MSIEGKTALVTGAARRMGLDFPRELASRSAVCYMYDVDQATLERSVGELVSGGLKVIAQKVDVSQEHELLEPPC